MKKLFLILILLSSCVHFPQDRPENCGQTCVAYVAGVSVRDVEAVIGHDGITYATDISKALRHYGIEHKDIVAYTGSLPSRAIVLLALTKDHHWVVWQNGKWFDPRLPVLVGELWNGEIVWFIELGGSIR